MYSVQRSLDPVPARSLVGRHNSWLLLCSFSTQRYLGENWEHVRGRNDYYKLEPKESFTIVNIFSIVQRVFLDPVEPQNVTFPKT